MYARACMETNEVVRAYGSVLVCVGDVCARSCACVCVCARVCVCVCTRACLTGDTPTGRDGVCVCMCVFVCVRVYTCALVRVCTCVFDS